MVNGPVSPAALAPRVFTQEQIRLQARIERAGGAEAFAAQEEKTILDRDYD